MTVAIATDGHVVSGHFGHCEKFMMYQIENGEITEKGSVANPGHRPGYLPNFLNEQGAHVVISGGMGGGAIDIFNGHNIEVIVGATGDVDGVIAAYLAGDLKSTGSVCHEHAHADSCH